MITRVITCTAVTITMAAVAGGAKQTTASLDGFTAARSAVERQAEQQFLPSVSRDRLRDAHRFLSDKPHLAGSARDRELAEWTRERFVESGLEDVQITEHQVLLPWPEEVSVEMVSPRAWRASMREDPIEGDPWSAAPPEEVGLPYNAYSPSGDITAEVVYAGSGNPENYDWLEAHGVDVRGKIALVRYSVPYSYRGFKALTAQQRGLAGLLIYSDPAEDGYVKGKVFPDGPWGPPSHIQRGGIPFDFMVPGDPLTPGWASVPGARRIDPKDAVSLPRIMSAPMSYRDARVILEALGGPETPEAWRGGLPITYHAGAGPAKVRLKLKSDDKIRPIWTVTGSIRGTDHPDQVVIIGNHRDAWVYGGVDPSSGSAALMELARTLGDLARRGHRPSRTIQFASWDAEEFTLTSSTEWGEQHADALRANAVAYLNIDSAASGPDFTVSAVPALNALLSSVADTVQDPRLHVSIAEASRKRPEAPRGALPTGSGTALVDNRLGSGSDYTVFLNFLGVPIADLTFDGPYGVYHSMYDDHQWVSTIGDPGFAYHAALVQVVGLMALRLANADVLPLHYEPYASKIGEFLAEVQAVWRKQGGHDELEAVGPALEAFERATRTFADRRASALDRGDARTLADLSARLLRVERAFTDPDGIPGRPWYKHQIYAPQFTYAPEVLPGIAEAMKTNDAAQVRAQAARLARALERAAAALTRP
ncbi:MAG TPA: M28 family metallopeptidase [Vicinamibacterales bacterium]|nr:M28 family metallopeptidase [Vicinamibacterales bacterium]